MAGARFNFKPNFDEKYGPMRLNPAYVKLQEVVELAKEKNVPEDVRTEIDNAIGMMECKELYLSRNCSNESDTLREIRLFTKEKDWAKTKEDGDTDHKLSARMMTGQIEGEFLKFLVSMQQAKRVLDIGMFTGYSALSMAEALPPDGVVITCDMEQYLFELNRKKFDESPHGAKIDIRIGDAKKTMLSLADEGQKFDFIFVDANKDDYKNYYNIIMDQALLEHNGTIVFDNALRIGKAYLTEGDPCDGLNKLVEKDPRVRRVLVPIRDGLLMVRRAEEVDP